MTLTKIDYLIITFGSIAYIGFGVFNNVGGSMMAYAMPAFPAWLLYGTTIMYTLGMFILCIFVKDNPIERRHWTWANQKHYWKLAVLTALNGLFFQFSAPWVDGAVSQVLANMAIIQIPIFERILIKERAKERTSKWWVGMIVIFIGIGLGMVPAIKKIILDHSRTPPTEQSDKWYWILAFIISTTFTAWEQTAQDQAFHDKSAKVTEVSCLAWYNLYSIPMYLITIPLEAVPILNGTLEGMSIKDAFDNQYGAFRCFFGHPLQSDIASGACQSGATLWPIIFTIGYIGFFCVGAFLINRFGVLFPNIVGANVELVAAITFMIPAIVGSNVVPFSVWPLIGCAIVVVGIILKGAPTNKKDPDRTEQPTEETPLVN